MIKAPVTKNVRQQEVLIGLVEFFLTTGKACGSNTLRENGFEQISSATIRNYFADLEKEGYLKQHHTSGGRTPTDKALRLYIESILSKEKKHTPSTDDKEFLQSIISKETKNLAFYLQEVTEAISELTSLTTIISAPRFDQDFITKIMLTKIDAGRALCIIVTDFGFIHTETIYFPSEIHSFSLKNIEQYFHYRLTSLEKPKLSEEEEAFAKHTYNEVVLRHFISYSNMDHPDIYKGGFAKLLRHSEFFDPETLANTLSLFENNSDLQKILLENNKLNILIGDDLKEFIPPPYNTSLVGIPYFIHNKPVGTIAILGPLRINYKETLPLLETISSLLSENLTKSLYKYQLTYRMPKSKAVTYTSCDLPVIGLTHKENL